MFNKPLWLDESALYLNLKFNYSQFFGGLLYNQSAPPLFMYVEKFIMENFGIKEYVLRAFPFICSVISIPVFYYFSKIFLKKISIVAAMFLFAVNMQLVYYAAEMKQYSSDVLCFMLLFIILNKLSIKNFQKKHIIIYSSLIILAPLISIPSYFLIGAWFLRELITSKKDWLKLVAAHIPLGVMSIFYCICTIIPQYKQTLTSYNMYTDYHGFLSLNIISNIKSFMHNTNFFFQPCAYDQFYFVLICIGLFIFLKNYKQKENILLISVLLISVIFSVLKIYPIYERIYLYALPALIVMLVKIIDISSKNKTALFCTAMIFLFLFKQYDINYVKNDYMFKSNSNPRTLMQILMSKYNENETVLIGACSFSEYLYYKEYFGFYPQKEIFIPVESISPKHQEFMDGITEPNNDYVLFFSYDCSSSYERECIKKWVKQYKVFDEKILNDNIQESSLIFFKK